jgi:hypothetical protein
MRGLDSCLYRSAGVDIVQLDVGFARNDLMT